MCTALATEILCAAAGQKKGVVSWLVGEGVLVVTHWKIGATFAFGAVYYGTVDGQHETCTMANLFSIWVFYLVTEGPDTAFASRKQGQPQRSPMLLVHTFVCVSFP